MPQSARTSARNVWKLLLPPLTTIPLGICNLFQADETPPSVQVLTIVAFGIILIDVRRGALAVEKADEKWAYREVADRSIAVRDQARTLRVRWRRLQSARGFSPAPDC